MATTWDDVFDTWKGSGLPTDEAVRLESVLKSADDYTGLDIDNIDCFVMSDGYYGWHALAFYEAVRNVYTNAFSEFATQCQSLFGFTPQSWADAYNTSAVFLNSFAAEINAEMYEISQIEYTGVYSIKGPFDIDFYVPAFGMVDADDEDYDSYTFPDSWADDSKEGVAGYPYFVLNPFVEPPELVYKTREHKLLDRKRWIIHRETSADLVKMKNGYDLERYIADLEERITKLEG